MLNILAGRDGKELEVVFLLPLFKLVAVYGLILWIELKGKRAI